MWIWGNGRTVRSNKIKRPSDFDSSIDYLVSLVRDGMDIDNIIKMLNEKIKEKWYGANCKRIERKYI